MALPAIDRRMFAPYVETAPTEQVLLHQFLKYNASKMDGTPASDAFSKDWDRGKKELYYDGQSIQRRYLGEFAKLDAIEKIYKMAGSQTENLEKGFEVIKTALKSRVVEDFNQYLSDALGESRAGLREEILWRFSPKALTQFTATAAARLAKKFNGYFPPGPNDSRVRLEIPKNGKRSVKIIVETRSKYTRFIPNGQLEPIDIAPIDFVGKVTYTIRFKRGWIWKTNVAESMAQAEIKYSRPKTAENA